MKRKKRAMTLLEIMIVILIIGIVGSVIGYNMRGSLERGKAFKSREGAKKVYEILTLRMAEGVTIDNVVADPVDNIHRSGLVSNPSDLLTDGWNQQYVIEQTEHGELKVISQRYIEFLERKGGELPFYMDIENQD